MMPTSPGLSTEERQCLLKLARQALEKGVTGEPLPELDWENISPNLREPGATFVTLTRGGSLRGCIGALEPRMPLAEDVREHAIAAALQDYRFPQVQPIELPEIRIEVSRLTLPESLQYERPEDLPRLLHPGIDGVILRDGFRRATFLPQVWEKIENPGEFLDHLCMKMGLPPNTWRRKKLDVQIYQVEEFHE